MDLRSVQLTAPIVGTSSCPEYLARSGAEEDMWKDYETSSADFSAGNNTEDPPVQHGDLRKEADLLGLWNPEAVARSLGFGNPDVEGQILAEDEEEDFLSEIMCNAGIEDPEPAEIQAAGLTGTSCDSKWFPYPNKMMFLLDSVDNLPRLRISSSLMRVLIWMLKEAGCKDIPSFDHLRHVQKSIRSECGILTIPCKSVQGNVFFMNDPAAIIAQDWANPMTRKLIHVYPEIPLDRIIREIWHAQKWCQNMDLDMLSPMYDSGSSHYYVNEVSHLKNGLFIVPIRWVIFRRKLHANVFYISFDEKGEATIIDKETSLVCADDFAANYLDLEHNGIIPKWTVASIEAGHSARMPNPKWAVAGGHPLYHSFVDYFGDDVSGNRTKSLNKHWNAYMTHRNLPHEVLQQEFHVHFISTSPNASVTEQFKEFKTVVEATHTDPVKVRDEDGGTTCLCLYVNSGPSDNPMQREISAHIGGKGNRFCRKCQASGTQKEKAENDDYHVLFEPGVPRIKQYILDELGNQVKLACSGVSQQVKDSQTKTGVKDMYTQYWIDQLISRFKQIKKDDPAQSNTDIEEELIQWTRANSDKIYSAFLTMKGFDPMRDTPVEILHTRSLIGRQFKTIVQTNIFHVHGLVTVHQFMGWKATGKLSALLWFPEIRDMAQYRIKYHLLIHIDDDAVEFGPLIGVMMEIFECFNAIFRYCSILSNHLALSRDIAIQHGDQEGLKHRLTGGWWCHGTSKDWKRAGPGVRQCMEKHLVLQKLLGWSQHKVLVHGSAKLMPFPRDQKARVQYKLGATSTALAVNFGDYSSESGWFKCCCVISAALDECFIGSWDQNSIISGRISEVLLGDDSAVLVVLELFQVLSVRDELYGMPVLNIRFNFNVQHDGYSGKYEASGVCMQMQERVESGKTENFIVHNPLDRYIINSHAFHNTHLLCATLPRDLLAPIPLFDDRRSKHDELAAALCTTLETKRTTRKEAAASKKHRADDDGSQPRKRKRTITHNAKAEATLNGESDVDTDAGDVECSDSDGDDLYNGLDSDCSD
ncbi:hypothetical protein B0H10DRAFT_2179282 [Mycena sp. CBHHK59/15]|nr:hypothetical protein B0H10DRAFT_2179282 [Mycena sp. CBHHK59/15]